MSSLKIGQIITIKQDMILKSALGDEEIKIPKGTKGIVGFDKLVYYQGGYIQSISENIEIEKDLDLNGLSKGIYYCLNRDCGLENLIENEIEYELSEYESKKEFKQKIIEAIHYALCELGF